MLCLFLFFNGGNHDYMENVEFLPSVKLQNGYMN